jgi:pyrophosphate--fructose-6-phosphate 1-phosphotransferase
LPKNLEIKIYGSKDVKPEIRELFPNLSRQTSTEKIAKSPLRVGVVLSGGQAPGGHNVINGLFDALGPKSRLIGFLDGPKGVIENTFRELKAEEVHRFRNTGGFDMIGSGRTKIETPEQFQASLKTAREHALDGLVIIGGDDSNTNAALLAEYFLAKSQPTAVVGVPKTIDGDLKNRYIEQSFGFDTAVKVYSEIVGNILKDALSAKKYWYFIRLMGRSASHITLEVARRTHPNLTLISEEHKSLEALLNEITTLITERARLKKPYGALLIPEGIIESLPELPKELFEGASYDAHGNLEVSKIEVERFFINLVKKRLDPSISFAAQPLFLGYEGRSAFPSHFDACYTYALGHAAAYLVAKEETGKMATILGLQHPVSEWTLQGSPLLDMLTLEKRKGQLKPVIEKALVDLNSPSYLDFRRNSTAWALDDAYLSPGPIQFWGPKEVVEEVVKL